MKHKMKHKMKELRRIAVVMFAVLAMVLCFNGTDKAYAATSGTIGTNKGFSWTYDGETKTLTVTGSDSGLDNGAIGTVANENHIAVENVIFDNCTISGSLANMFADTFAQGLKSIDFKDNCDTSAVTNMSTMFSGCTALTSLNVKDLDTSAVTMIEYIFWECRSLQTLDLSNWDLSLVQWEYEGGELMFNTKFSTLVAPKEMGDKIVQLYMAAYEDAEGNIYTELSSATEGKTLSAITEPFTITYELNGGINHAQNPATYEYTPQYDPITLKEPTRAGYMFEGWYKDATFKTKITEIKDGSVGDITVYAKWKENKTYTVKYELNGGTNNKSNPTSYTYDGKTKVVLKEPTRIGYTFDGWYKQAKFYNKVTELGAEDLGNITLYAKWTLNKYTIAFDGNGATSGKVSSLTKREYGKEYTLSENRYKLTGYTFTGWNTRADGKGTTYADKAKVKNLTTENGATVTLYAQWKKTDFKITYELNGGTNHKDNPATYQMLDFGKEIYLQNPTQKGYKFLGWYCKSKKIQSIQWDRAEDLTIEAKWEPIAYWVVYDGNGATSGAMVSKKELNNSDDPYDGYSQYHHSYDDKFQLEKNAFKMRDYKFVGWNTKKDGSGKSYKDGATVSKLTTTDGQIVVLYAQWEYNYKIVYNLNGGTNNKKNVSSYSPYETTKLKNPTKKGYTFKGWYKDKKFKKKVTQIKKGTTGKVTLYAKWAKVSVKKATLSSAKNSKSKQIVVKYKKSSGAKGYEISYSTDENFKKSVTKKTSTKTTYTIKSLKKGTTYYVRVRAYKLDSAGKKVYGKYSKVIKVKVKK